MTYGKSTTGNANGAFSAYKRAIREALKFTNPYIYFIHSSLLRHLSPSAYMP